MDLSKTSSVAACNKLKNLLTPTMESIKTKVFTYFPESNLPDNFIIIQPNGGITDRGDCCEGFLLILIGIKLLKKSEVNEVKLANVLESFGKVLVDGGIRMDDTYFVIDNKLNFNEGNDYSLGYSVKSIHVFFRVQRTNN